jgi:cytochrome P450 family 97 subfamily B polypeptide 3
MPGSKAVVLASGPGCATIRAFSQSRALRVGGQGPHPFVGKTNVLSYKAKGRSSAVRLAGTRRAPTCLAGELVAVGLFFTPGLLATAYALYLGKGDLTEGGSRLITTAFQGYFQPFVGGANIPVAEGKLSDLAGDQPLFTSLYAW